MFFFLFLDSSSLRETITQHLYGVSKKDHVNYSYISSIDDKSSERDAQNDSLEVNQLSAEQRRVVLPSFEEMINHVYEMSIKRLSNSSTQRHVYGRATLAYSYEVYTEVKSIGLLNRAQFIHTQKNPIYPNRYWTTCGCVCGTLQGPNPIQIIQNLYQN